MKTFQSPDILRAIEEVGRNGLVDAISDGFVSLHRNQVFVAPVVHLGSNPKYPLLGGGDVCLKSGYILKDDYFVVKIAGGSFKGYDNDGLMLVFNQKNGSISGILFDKGILTELRTAAAGALSIKHFAPKNIGARVYGFIGTGIQTRYQMEMIANVFNVNKYKNKIYIYGRNKDRLNKCKQDVLKLQNGRLGLNESNVIATQDLLDIGTKCNVIIMCTNSKEAILKTKHFRDNKLRDNGGIHIVCIGADTVGKQELDTNVVLNCDLIVCDSYKQCTEFGELQHVTKENKLNQCNVVELGKSLEEKKLFRKDGNDNRMTMFDSTGVAIQDVVIAKIVYDQLANNTKQSKL